VTNNRDIDEALERAARTPHEVSPALLDAVAGSIKSSIEPMRSLPPAWVLSGALILISAAVAIAGAARAGFHGLETLDVLQAVSIFFVPAVPTVAAAQEFVSQMIPGSRHLLQPRTLMQTSVAVLLVVFAFVFRDYATFHFLSAGLVCLAVGVVHAAPAGLLSWWVLRRGFAVDSVAAGFAAGLLGGLVGVTMLELHCDNFQAPHIILWAHRCRSTLGSGGSTGVLDRTDAIQPWPRFKVLKPLAQKPHERLLCHPFVAAAGPT
jgi:hypothetical protein